MYIERTLADVLDWLFNIDKGVATESPCQYKII